MVFVVQSGNPIIIQEGLVIQLPISDALITDADTHAVAVMARDAVGQQAYDAVYDRARALEDKE